MGTLASTTPGPCSSGVCGDINVVYADICYRHRIFAFSISISIVFDIGVVVVVGFPLTSVWTKHELRHVLERTRLAILWRRDRPLVLEMCFVWASARAILMCSLTGVVEWTLLLLLLWKGVVVIACVGGPNSCGMRFGEQRHIVFVQKTRLCIVVGYCEMMRNVDQAWFQMGEFGSDMQESMPVAGSVDSILDIYKCQSGYLLPSLPLPLGLS